MALALLLPGIALVLLVFVDTAWTTLGLNRAGPVAGRVAGWTWKTLAALNRRTGSHAFLSIAGTVTLLAVAAAWVLLLYGGWLLVFLSTPEAVVHDTTGAPADFESRLYYVGYTLVTLGIGDYVPTAGWKFVTILCSLHGLSELTLAISYLLSVLGSVIEGRTLASSVSGLGSTPQAILTRAWTGHGFGDLPSHLTSITRALSAHVYAHQAYPAIHYFHTGERVSSPPLRIAMLDETVTLLECAVREDARPAPPTLHALQFALSQYLRLLNEVYVAPAEEPPAPPGLQPLRDAGIPVVPDAVFRERLAQAADRRRVLAGLVHHDGWSWEDVRQETEASPSDGLQVS